MKFYHSTRQTVYMRFALMLFLFSAEVGLQAQITTDTMATDSIKEMDGVVITGNRIPSLIKEATVSITNVRPYLFQSRITNDATQLLDQLPGVNVTDNQVNIRSGSGWSYGAGSRVMILVDGMPLLSGDAAAPLWSFIPMEAMEGIEVVKGAASVLYGSSALNGILHFKTRNAPLGNYFNMQINGGVYSSGNQDGLNYSKGRNFQTAQGYWSRNAIKHQWNVFSQLSRDNGYRMEEFLDKFRLGAGYKYLFGKQEKYRIGLKAMAQISNGGSFLLWESYKLGYSSLDSGFNHTLGKRLQIDPHFEIINKNTIHRFQSRLLWISNDNNNGDPGSNQDNSSFLSYSEYLGYLKPLPSGTTLTWGAVYQYSSTLSPLFSGSQNTSNRSAFIQIEQRLFKNLIIHLGGRYEYFTLNDKIFQKPVFRAGINKRISKAGFARSSFGQGYRFPSIGETFISTSVGPVKVYPNLDLKPESGWNIELGYKQFFENRRIRGYVDLAFYHMRLENMMEFTFAQWSKDNLPANLYGFGFKSVNTGDAKITGIELEAGIEFFLRQSKLKILAGYNYSSPINVNPSAVFAVDSLGKSLSFENTRSDQGNTLKYRYRNLGRIDILWEYRKIEIGLGWKYNSQIENIDKAFQDVPIALFVPGVKEARDITAVNLFDVRLGYEFRRKYKVRFMVNNVTNELYMTRPADLRPPRSFHLQFSYNLQ